MITNIQIKNLINNGSVLVKNALNNIQVEKIKKIALQKMEKKHTDQRLMSGTNFFAITPKQYLIKLIKFEFNKISNSLYLKDVSKKLKLNLIADNFYREKSKLSMIHSYHTPKQKQEIRPWHSDRTYEYIDGQETQYNSEKIIKFPNPNYTALKFFFYLTPVGPKNGCTSYMPGSHEITNAVRSCIYENEIKYTSFRKLEDLVNLIYYNNNYKILSKKLGSEILLKDFLKNAELMVENQNLDTYDFEANPGDLLIFNDGGIHRGSKPSISERLVIRYMYLVKSFGQTN
jgi:ectoine hydroxylase-related dioxygenase (phytanoyl-CoA dioxygenase family)